MPLKTKLPRYVEKNIAKGRVYYRVRYHGRRIAQLPDDPTSAEFFEAYAAAMRRIEDDPKPAAHAEGTLGWVIASYRASSEFLSLTSKTQSGYDRELERLQPIQRFSAAAIRRRHIRAIRDTLQEKPRTQKAFTQVCSLLFNFAIDELEIAMINPASRMRRTGDPESYIPWTPSQMLTFEQSSPPVELMTAYMIARYTGPRRTDAVNLKRNHYDRNTLSIAGSKTQNPVIVRAHRDLRAYLDKQPPTLYLIADETGRPVTPTALTHAMRKHLDSIGLTDLHLHGLRHTAGTELADAGCSSHEIQAVLGHKTLQMTERYTRKANQRRLAESAVLKLEQK